MIVPRPKRFPGSFSCPKRCNRGPEKGEQSDWRSIERSRRHRARISGIMVARITTADESSHLVQWPIQKSQLFNRHAAPKLVLQEQYVGVRPHRVRTIMHGQTPEVGAVCPNWAR